MTTMEKPAGQGGLTESDSAAQHVIAKSTGAEAAAKWFSYLYGDQPEGLISISRFADANGQRAVRDGLVARTPREAAEIAMTLDGQSLGTFHRLTTLPSDWSRTGTRGVSVDAHYCYAVQLDCDIAHPVAHKDAAYPESWEQWEKALYEAGLPEPSYLIHSGYGAYPGWKLERPANCSDTTVRGRIEKLQKDLRDLVHAWAQHLYGAKLDSTYDLARVFKVPGTHNRKVPGEAPEVTVLKMGGAEYAFQELEMAMLSAPKPAAAAAVIDLASASAVAVLETPAAPSRLFPSVAAKVIRTGDRPYAHEAAAEYLKAAAGRLAEAEPGGFNRAIFNFARECSHFPIETYAFCTQEWVGQVVIAVLGPRTGWTEPDHQDQATIASAFRKQIENREAELAAGAPLDSGWEAYVPAASEAVVAPRQRRVDLSAYLDGTYEPPAPSVGGERTDGLRLLYPGKWHTLIAPTATGKSWYGLWHVVTEIRAGNTVAYCHFEETSPGGTLMRLREMAPDLSIKQILEHFVWLDCADRWAGPAEFAEALPEVLSLLVLDGINAASTRHGWDPSDVNTVGQYTSLLVTPATRRDAAVLSLGHPPKARGRETERHGFGSTAWLDNADGVAFRLVPSKKPISRGKDGYAMLYSVKDRYGQVEMGGVLAEEGGMEGWYALGAFHVDSSVELSLRLTQAQLNAQGLARDKIDVLGDQILNVLRAGVPTFKSARDLQDRLRAGGGKFTERDVPAALLRLSETGRVDWPEVADRKPRPGSLTFLGASGGEAGMESE